MIKRRKMSESGGDLADINEQELAKDRASDEYGNTGTDTTIGESVPVCSEKAAEKDMDTVPERHEDAVTKDEILPLLAESNGEASGDIIPCDKEEKQEKQDIFEDIPICDEDKPNKAKRETPKSKKKRGRIYVFIIAACFIISIALLAFVALKNDDEDDLTVEQSESTSPTVTDTEEKFSANILSGEELYSKCKNSSVTVISHSEKGDRYYSGFGIFENGYIATLYEAVAESQSVEIVLCDGRAFPADVIGGDATVNLALLYSDTAPVEYVKIGNTDELLTGSRVYAVGSMGEGKYGASFASSEVSCQKRNPELMGFDGYKRRINGIQLNKISDACMKGAPVFDEYGEAVAVVFSAGEEYPQSFAFPIDGVFSVLEQIKLGEELDSEVLNLLAYIPSTLGILGEQINVGEAWGIAIRGFTDDTCDAALKLRIDDVIVKINDTPTPDTQSLTLEVEKYRAGEEIEVFVIRNGQELSFCVTLTKI